MNQRDAASPILLAVQLPLLVKFKVIDHNNVGFGVRLRPVMHNVHGIISTGHGCSRVLAIGKGRERQRENVSEEPMQQM